MCIRDRKGLMTIHGGSFETRDTLVSVVCMVVGAALGEWIKIAFFPVVFIGYQVISIFDFEVEKEDKPVQTDGINIEMPKVTGGRKPD